MRDLVYYVATSLDGFIAREDGSFEDFPWDDAFVADLMKLFPETFPTPFHEKPLSRSDNQRFDTVLMGRKTYEVGVRQNLTNPYATLAQYVFSRSWEESPDPAVTLVSTDPAAFVARLKGEPGASIWICGGGQLASSLLSAGLVDELIFKVNPVLLGVGIPVFSGGVQPTGLELVEHRVYPSGHVLLTYHIRR